MNAKQKIMVIAPLVLIAVMYPIFRALAGVMNPRFAWFLGLAVYWIIWGAVFPLVVIGKENIRALIRLKKPDTKTLLLIAVPLLGALGSRFLPGMAYEKESIWIALLVLSTPFGNGFFEELLWRGVYARLFPESVFLRMIWPSIWFALWHYVPGSVLHGNVVGLMIGAGMMGLYLSYLTKRTDNLFWAILIHTLGGLIVVF